MNLDEIKKYDISEMYKIYDNWPELASKSYSDKIDHLEIPNITHIVFSGMGGSGIIGDIFSAIFSKTKIHVSIVKGYILPKTVDSKTLIICLSSSGNTEETLFVLQSAFKLGCKIFVVTSGGKLAKFCKENQIEFYKADFVHSPRASLPNLLYPLLKILQNILPLKSEEILDSITNLRKTREKIHSSNLSNTNPALNMACWIKNIPIIYYPHGLQSVAIRFKNSLQENSKMHVMMEDVIEACHNNVVAWEKTSKILPIIIRGVDDHKKTKERWEILKKLLKKYDVDFWEISSISGNVLSKIISLIYILDYVSIYRAILSKTDPTPIRPLEFIKSKLN